MNLGKSILLSILLLCYGASGYASTRTIDMVSIVTDSSQCETVIKKILRIGWYGLSAELKYIDPWAHVGSKRSKSETQIEQPQSLEDNTSTPIQIDTRALGLVLLIILSLAICVLQYSYNKSSNDAPSKGDEHFKEKESDVRYDDIQRAQMAAENGNVVAQTVLGQMYYDGQIIPQDFKQAYIWFSVATAMGSLPAKKLRDQAIEKLTPESIEAAQAQATKFFESLTSKKTQAEYEPDLEEITTEEKELNNAPHKVTKLNKSVTSVKELPNTTEQKTFYKTLLNGDYSLTRTFWVYFLLFNGCLSLLIQTIPIFESLPVFVMSFCIVIWWQISTIIGTIRSAIKYKGPKIWSVMAIAITAINGLFACVYAYVVAYAMF